MERSYVSVSKQAKVIVRETNPEDQAAYTKTCAPGGKEEPMGIAYEPVAAAIANNYQLLAMIAHLPSGDWLYVYRRHDNAWHMAPQIRHLSAQHGKYGLSWEESDTNEENPHTLLLLDAEKAPLALFATKEFLEKKG